MTIDTPISLPYTRLATWVVVLMILEYAALCKSPYRPAIWATPATRVLSVKVTRIPLPPSQ